MGPIGSGVFLIGLLSCSFGFLLFFLEVRSRGAIDTRWGKFSGPIFFILIAFGLVLMVTGWMLPI